MTTESNKRRKGRRVIRNAREGVRRSYEVEYIPESEGAPSPIDLLIQKLLSNRGKTFVLLEKTNKKASSASSLVRRLRRRAEEGGVGEFVTIVSRSFWSEGLVRVFGRAITEDEHKKLIAKREHDERRDEGGSEG